MFLSVCGWVGFIVLGISAVKNLIDTFRGENTKDRIASFIAFILLAMTEYYIGNTLFK